MQTDSDADNKTIGRVCTPHTDRAGNTRLVEIFALLVVEEDGRTRLEALAGYEFTRPGERIILLDAISNN